VNQANLLIVKANSLAFAAFVEEILFRMVDQEIVLEKKLVTLKDRHRSIDRQIEELNRSTLVDELEIRRLKKQKLQLKDEICQLEELIYPDIIA
jgi:hypothetical protein